MRVCSAASATLPRYFVCNHEKEEQSLKMGNPASKQGKRSLRKLPEVIYFSFRVKRKVTKEKLAVTGVEPVRSYPADFKSAASTNSATPPPNG